MKKEEILAIVAGHVNQELLLRNEYLAVENKILKSKLKGKMKFNESERLELAKIGKKLGLKALKGVATIVKPETILTWYRKLIAKKFDSSKNRIKHGRPFVSQEIESLVLKFAKENPDWGYDRIAGSLKNLGYTISDETVANILRRNQIPRTPRNKPELSWSDFIEIHQNIVSGCDFFTVEVFTQYGLVTFYILFFIQIGSRKVHIAGVTTNPHEKWMKQIAKNLTMDEWGFLNHQKYLILDRDTKFCKSFQSIIEKQGINLIRIPPRSPNLNGYAERFVRTIKEECLSKLIVLNEKFLRQVLREFITYYHEERNHQGKQNNLLFPKMINSHGFNRILKCKKRLGGLLKFYYFQDVQVA